MVRQRFRREQGGVTMTDQDRVIVQSHTSPGHSFASTQVYHRDLPEIRASGENPASAAEHLANQLSRALDTALTDWRRQNIQNAIADVQAFIGQGKTS